MDVSLRFFSCIALLLPGGSLRDVEVSGKQRVIHKKVGDTVELSSGAPAKGVTTAQWLYGQTVIADKNVAITEASQFKDRLHLNNTTFDLTVKGLTVQDSGDFSFVSEVNDQQGKTIIIRLQVHAPITTKPVLNSSSTWSRSTKSCTISLECNASPDTRVMYNWTVRNQTFSGRRLQYILKPQDGDTIFTCRVYNFVSQMSKSKTVKCNKDTQELTTQEKTPSSSVPLIIRWVIGFLVTFLLLSLLFYTKSKDRCCNRLTQSQTVSQDETQQQVYSSLLHGDGSAYETLGASEDAGKGGATDGEYSNVESS